MVAKTKPSLASLYQLDEVAWLDAMADLIGSQRVRDLDFGHLKEFLEDMSRRDRREVESRLEILLAHLLKWTFQKKKRTRSWRQTIATQRRELTRDFRSSKALRNHAEKTLADVYCEAVAIAAEETGLSLDTFPATCPWTLEQLLSAEVLGQGQRAVWAIWVDLRPA